MDISVHSLGVLHLGNKAVKNFRKNVEKISGIGEVQWDKWEHTFQLACLLHDVGHSPFSHTGEDFYEQEGNFREILGNTFKKKELNGPGKPHEVMSALVGLDLIKKYDKNQMIDKELFARCIIGAGYLKTEKNYLYANAIIGMLNGSVIDVDKLDYLIRDAYVTGYDSVSLDVDRLLESYTIIESKGKKRVAYKRGALSVIENVVYANDLEHRWIQNNPTILYDCKLLEYAIRHYDSYMKEYYCDDLKGCGNILCKKALSQDGFQSENLKLRLLCDDDIVAYLKNTDTSEIGRQYFDRHRRLTPMWKNEVDFTKIISGELGDNRITEIMEELDRMEDVLKDTDSFFINDDTKKKLEETYRKELEDTNGEQKTFGEKIEERKKICAKNMKLFELFEGFQQKNRLPDFQFAIVSNKSYESNYKKLELEEIYIELGKDRIPQFSETLQVNSVKGQRNVEGKIFYVYTTRKNKDQYKGDEDIGEAWAQYVSENWRRIYGK